MSLESARTRSAAWRAYALAGAGGVVLFLGWAGFRLWPLELVGLVPLWAALEHVKARRFTTALFVGWLYGTVAIAGGYHFMWEFTRAFSGFGVLASTFIFVAFSVYLGLQFGFQGLLYWAIRRRGWGVTVAAIPTLPVTEWLFPKLFPVYLGNALIEVPLLVQTVDLGGPLLASVTVAAINAAVFECIRAWRGMRPWPMALVSCVLVYVSATLAYGALRVAEIEDQAADAPFLSVGLVQANVSIEETQADPYERPRRYQVQSRAFEDEVGPLDLVVWPEAVFYPWIVRTLPGLGADVSAGLQSPLLLGSTTFVPATDYTEKYNSALLVHVDGLIGQRYDKNELVMFGEYLPFADTFPSLYDLVPNSDKLTAGSSVAPLRLGPWRLFASICYEDLLPTLIRRAVREGDPHVLVNLTNDGWFRDSQGAWIHLRLAQFRAIEHRRYLLRAANTGVSAIIDAAGRVVQRTVLETPDNLHGVVPMLEGQTVYARSGDWPAWASLVATILAITRKRPGGRWAE